MKRHILGAIFVYMAMIAPVQTAEAEDMKTGLGIISGEPTGISGKMWTGRNTAIDGAVGWSFVDDAMLHIHADMLWHNWSFLKEKFEVEQGEIPLYYGVGGRIRFEDDARIGARFVLGFSYIFENAPFDIFLELAPILDLAPESELNGNFAIGVRYWF